VQYWAPRITADANRRFYAAAAEEYDLTEDCVIDPVERERLRRALSKAIAAASERRHVLDACGGSGNASLVLHELGVTPVTVDISPEMLNIYRRKAKACGYEAETKVAEIQGFLQDDDRRWNLVVFSSALHHLEDYGAVLALAVRRLAPGGVLVTILIRSPSGRSGTRSVVSITSSTS